VSVTPAPPLHSVQGSLLYLGARGLETKHGAFRAHLFRNLSTRQSLLAVARGDLASPPPLLARVHSSCVTSEAFAACDCDCAEQLDGALGTIAASGRGVIFYLMQEGRGAGFALKARDRMMVQASRDAVTTFEAFERMGLHRDQRRYEEVASVIRILGITSPLELLTNNPDKVAAMERQGIAIARVLSIRHRPSPYNLHYLAAKSRSGHALGEPASDASAAELPEPVACFAPYAVAGSPGLVHMASYLLPIRTRRKANGGSTRPVWFKSHVYFDLDESIERVVLTYRRSDSPAPLVRIQGDSLLERFSLSGGGGGREGWLETVERIVARGAGCAIFLAPDPLGGTRIAGEGAGAAPTGETIARLVALHLAGRPAQLLLDGPPPTERDRALERALARAGARMLPALFLGDAIQPQRDETAR
jgi:3,4-dihydroxy 2-butanone 4-phosphate synthase/GTP cyclohydrolase II